MSILAAPHGLRMTGCCSLLFMHCLLFACPPQLNFRADAWARPKLSLLLAAISCSCQG